MTKNMKPNITLTYDEYFEYMLGYTKKLEVAVTDNTTSRKANVAESDYLLPYSPSDECYNDASDLSSYMVDRGGDMNMMQDILQCNQAIKQGKPVCYQEYNKNLYVRSYRLKTQHGLNLLMIQGEHGLVRLIIIKRWSLLNLLRNPSLVS